MGVWIHTVHGQKAWVVNLLHSSKWVWVNSIDWTSDSVCMLLSRYSPCAPADELAKPLYQRAEAGGSGRSISAQIRFSTVSATVWRSLSAVFRDLAHCPRFIWQLKASTAWVMPTFRAVTVVVCSCDLFRQESSYFILHLLNVPVFRHLNQSEEFTTFEKSISF